MYLIYHPSFIEHEHWPGHPERPERLVAIKKALEDAGLWRNPIEIEPAPQDLVGNIHAPEYISRLKSRAPGCLDPDTQWAENTYDIAMRAMGGAYTAAKRTFDTGEPGLCLLRPPGHHAGPDYYMGFCYFNNAALAAEFASKHVERTAVIDIDVHHGNGTNDILAHRKDVLYISTHQWGIFPGTGHYTDRGQGEGEGYNVNIPLRSRSGDTTYKMAFEGMIGPILEEYKPGFMVVSIGADAHYMDPLAGLTLSTPGYMKLCQSLIDTAKKVCQGHIIFVLEGGYDLGALSDVVVGLASMLDGTEYEPRFAQNRDIDGEGANEIQEAGVAHRELWGF